jgi:Flp pilus assembly protein TadG
MFGRIKSKIARRRSERGSVIAMAAVGMVSLILASGMAIDISHFYAAGTELQNAADAAALAGASALNHTDDGIKIAVDRAVAAMNKYEFNGANVAIGRENVRFAKNLSSFDGSGTGMSEGAAQSSPQDIRFVKVNVPTTAIQTYFASMVLGPAVNLNRSAVAGQSSTSTGVNTVCNAAPFVFFEDCDGDLDIVEHNTEVCDCFCPNEKFQQGHTYRIKELESTQVKNSTYAIIEPPTGRTIDPTSQKQKLSLGLDCITTCQTLQTSTVNYSDDSIRAAINTRFDEYDGIPTNFVPPDTNIKNGIKYKDYKSGDGAQSPSRPGVNDRRIMIIPIARKSDFNETTRKVKIHKYGVFFLTKKADSKGTLEVEFIQDSVVVGDGSFNPTLSCDGSTQITVPVLYR